MHVNPAVAVLIGPFPGPVHGVSVINAKLAERMAAGGLVVDRIDLSPGFLHRGPAYHLKRTMRTLGGVARILTSAFQGRRRTVLSVDGGYGLLYNLALTFAIRLTGGPLMLYHHSSGYVLSDNILMRALLAIAGRDVPHVFCSAKMARLFCERYKAAGAAFIVNNAAWVDSVSSGAGSGGRLRLGFLSALSLEKGLGRAIDTLRLLREQGADAELFLAGATVDEQAREILRLAQTEFDAALVQSGVLEGADKTRFYSTLDVFLFPSLYPHETQSLVVPEALAAATPVIAYDHRFVGEILGEGGLLVSADKAFADAAVDWITAERGEWQARRGRARQQFEYEQNQAAGQIDSLIAWLSGGST